jgi:hypothetical protein
METISRETLEFLNWLLSQVTLSASSPAFEEQAKRIVVAQREIATALEGMQ